MTQPDAVYTQRTKFSFPELNETQVLENGGNNVGNFPLQSLSTLRNSNDNKVNLLAFQPVLSAEDRQASLYLFQTFVRACSKFNVTFFLYGGALIGSLRHHDIIPWDDDIDVLLNTTERPLLHQALSNVGSDFSIIGANNTRWKFFWTKPKSLLEKSYRWPFIDIFFFSENATHIYDEEPVYQKDFSYYKHQVFPLCLRPFAGSLLPVPRNSTAVVHHNYSPDHCSSLQYSHKLEKRTPKNLQATVHCKELHGLYPFVHRETINGKVYEHLMINNTQLGTFIVPEHCG
ncbi:fukutin-related protein [Biomphalaria glabrata]|nr:fukutin-related protein [Biomphalaria glabrata]